MNWHNILKRYVGTKPLVIFQFDETDSNSLWESRRGPNQFSFTKPHEDIEKLKTPAPCIIYLTDGKKKECLFGIAKSKSSVSTLDSRVMIQMAMQIKPANPVKLEELIENKRVKDFFKDKIAYNSVGVLTEKSSILVIEALSKHEYNHAALETVSMMLSNMKHLPPVSRMQYSAVKLAMAAFGLSKEERPCSIYTKTETDTTLKYMNRDVRLTEDNVIAEDARSIPGFKLIESDVTGWAVFVQGDEKLEVYTANRNKLEEMLGVDLIYINSIKKNIVMIQYKMLEPQEQKDNEADGETARDWIFRPDKQFYKEKDKMILLKSTAKEIDYRLNNEPFYFKFIKRIEGDNSRGNIILPLEHLEKVLKDSKGSRGGTIISYKILGGRYLRETEFLGLIRAGYIGTHSEDSEHMESIIKQVSRGNNAIVLAWQSKLAKEDMG